MNKYRVLIQSNVHAHLMHPINVPDNDIIPAVTRIDYDEDMTTVTVVARTGSEAMDLATKELVRRSSLMFKEIRLLRERENKVAEYINLLASVVNYMEE